MLLVSSVTVTSVNATVIGGLHSGWKVAVTVRVNLALRERGRKGVVVRLCRVYSKPGTAVRSSGPSVEVDQGTESGRDAPASEE
jgi:hypothetical protein